MDRKRALKIILALLALIFIIFAISNNWYKYERGISFGYKTNDPSSDSSNLESNKRRVLKVDETGFRGSGNRTSYLGNNNFSILSGEDQNVDSIPQVLEGDIPINEEDLVIDDTIPPAIIDDEDGILTLDSASLNACALSHESPYLPVLVSSDSGVTLSVPLGSRVFLPVLDETIPDAGQYETGFSINRLGDGSVDIISHDGSTYSLSSILSWFDFHNASVTGGYTFSGGHTLVEYQCDLLCSDVPEDLNNDGAVNVIDLLLVVGDYGCLSGSCLGDLSDDGVVGVEDMLMITSAYGTSCQSGVFLEDDTLLRASTSYSPVSVSTELAKPSVFSPYNYLVSVENVSDERLRSLQTEALVPSIFKIHKVHAPISGGSSVSSSSKAYVPSLYRGQSITYSFLVSLSDTICNQVSKNYEILVLYGLCGEISDSIIDSDEGSLYDDSDDADRPIYNSGLDPDYFFDDGIKDEGDGRTDSRLQIQTREEKEERIWVHPRDRIIIKGY